MYMIISPAKRMRTDTDTLPPRDLPAFLPEAERLLGALRALPPGERKALWRCSDAIAARNEERLGDMALHRGLTPAILSYEGIQYQYMAPGVFETGQYGYLQRHLRILSGLYGILRPFDGVTPYRLEMQARLAADGHRDLYDFWGDKLARSLDGAGGLVINLASREYSRAVEPHLGPEVRFLTCVFGERQGDKIVEKGTLCKMARGEMVRWMAEHEVTQADALKEFCGLGYRFSAQDSGAERYVFLKG